MLRKGNEIAYNQTNSDASQTQSEFCGKEKRCNRLRKPPSGAMLHRLIVAVWNMLYSSHCRRRMRVALRVAGIPAGRGKVSGLERADNSGKRTTSPGKHGTHLGKLCCLACLHGNDGKIRSAQRPKPKSLGANLLTVNVCYFTIRHGNSVPPVPPPILHLQ